jgi:protein-disulfide isomerase
LRCAEHFIGQLKSLSWAYFKTASGLQENWSSKARKRTKAEQNEEKFLLEPLKQILPSRIRFSNR